MILCFEHNCLVELYTKRRFFAQNVAFVSIETYKREKNLKDNSSLRLLGLKLTNQDCKFLKNKYFQHQYRFILNRITIYAFTIYITTDYSLIATYMDTTKLF